MPCRLLTPKVVCQLGLVMVLTSASILSTVLYYHAPNHMKVAWRKMFHGRVVDGVEDWEDPTALEPIEPGRDAQIQQEAYEIATRQAAQAKFQKQMKQIRARGAAKERALKRQNPSKLAKGTLVDTTAAAAGLPGDLTAAAEDDGDATKSGIIFKDQTFEGGTLSRTCSKLKST